MQVAGCGACPACRGQVSKKFGGAGLPETSVASRRTGHLVADAPSVSWVCTLAHTLGPTVHTRTRLAREWMCWSRAAQKGKKASSYTTTAAINQCCRRTVKQYDVASIIDGNPSSAFRDFSRHDSSASEGLTNAFPAGPLIPNRISVPRDVCKFEYT